MSRLRRLVGALRTRVDAAVCKALGQDPACSSAPSGRGFRVRRWDAPRSGERVEPPAPPAPPAEPPRPPCAGLWDTPMVHVNGDLTTCCLDEGLENRLGNVRETPLAALWTGPTIHRWRVAQAQGRFEDSGPLCTRCNWRSAGAVDAEALRKYLEATGESPSVGSSRRPPAP